MVYFQTYFCCFQNFKLLASILKRWFIASKKIEPWCDHVTLLNLDDVSLLLSMIICCFEILVSCLEEEWIEFDCLDSQIIFWTSFNLHHGHTFISWLQ
jgi:hypothetical protein